MATYSFHRLIMGKVEIGNFYRLIGDNRILFLQKCLLNSSPHFIGLLLELLNYTPGIRSIYRGFITFCLFCLYVCLCVCVFVNFFLSKISRKLLDLGF